MKLSEIRDSQPGWFSRKNKRFFGDLNYRVLHGKHSKKGFLVRSTFEWSDMCGGEKRISWRINEVDQETLKIRSLIDGSFRSLDSVKDYLRFL